MASSLKELTWKHHQKAEEQPFAQLLISGDIEPKTYLTYLFNQFLCYATLEEAIMLPKELHGVFRKDFIFEDMQELQADFDLDPCDTLLETTKDYILYMQELRNNEDNHKLLAHLYVRHFGDLHGGQIIAQKVPGTGRMYKFQDRKKLVDGIRELLDDNMAEEAQLCFDYATRAFEELNTL